MLLAASARPVASECRDLQSRRSACHAYADIFAGRRQEKIRNYPPAEDFRNALPDADAEAQKQLRLGFDGVHRSRRGRRCVRSQRSRHFDPRRVLPKLFLQIERAPDRRAAAAFSPEVYGGSRTDIDTFVDVFREVPKRHPRLLVIHLGDADEEAHLHARVQRKLGQHYGIFHYHQALRQDDYLPGESGTRYSPIRFTETTPT